MDWYDTAEEYDRQTWGRDDQLGSLPHEWQRELVALMLLNRDVNNGAYLQFLANHGRDTYAHASRALRTIGAHAMADIIDRCQALVDECFPSEGRPHSDLIQLLPNQIVGRGGTVKEGGSVLPDSVLARLSELSREFMDYPDNVAELAQTYFGPLIEGDERPLDSATRPDADPETSDQA